MKFQRREENDCFAACVVKNKIFRNQQHCNSHYKRIKYGRNSKYKKMIFFITTVTRLL